MALHGEQVALQDEEADTELESLADSEITSDGSAMSDGIGLRIHDQAALMAKLWLEWVCAAMAMAMTTAMAIAVAMGMAMDSHGRGHGRCRGRGHSRGQRPWPLPLPWL